MVRFSPMKLEEQEVRVKVRPCIKRSIGGSIFSLILFGGILLITSIKHTPNYSIQLEEGKEGYYKGSYLKAPWNSAKLYTMKTKNVVMDVNNVVGSSNSTIFEYKKFKITYNIKNVDDYACDIYENGGDGERYFIHLVSLARKAITNAITDISCIPTHITASDIDVLPLPYITVTKLTHTPPRVVKN